ncbi:putative mitochondrial protein [Sesamum angolense]|uniref:Mitochondrial protein n=1 Tax=Sesamum angolense TaxID=2727404 RepID=A0AAE1T650_9LAMI|nr:putative mitochondrial protein [Sesamum angolense]
MGKVTVLTAAEDPIPVDGDVGSSKLMGNQEVAVNRFVNSEHAGCSFTSDSTPLMNNDQDNLRVEGTRVAMEEIIEGGPWLFQGQPIVLQFWEQGMSLRRQKHTQVPVWIRLKHLPMEYWTDEGLNFAETSYRHVASTCPDSKKTSQGPPITIFVKKQSSNRGPEQPERGTEVELTMAGSKSTGSAGRELWGGLRTLAVGISDEPWLVLGDFNAVLDDSEVRGRAADTSVSMAEFRTCILDTGLVQLPFTGCPYTWHNCSEGTRSLWKRLDRMLVNEAWLEKWPGSSYVSALPRTKMYEVVCKLKALKAVFRRQRKQKGDLTENVKLAKGYLDKAQELFAVYRDDVLLHLVKCCRMVYSEAIKLEMSMLKQRAKLRWMKHGDQNSRVFFRKINSKRAKHMIFQITNAIGEVNTTLLALIPKVNLPSYVSDYRPISCCNVLYKAITKVIVQRMQPVLHLLIDFSQNAFVPGRSIADNILLAQELLAGYNQRRLPPRCTLKVDIQKAYDSVEWDFLLEVLRLFNFPPRFVGWIEQCVSTASFSVSLNGAIYGFFKGRRGLRQGDPMSPYLFVLVMEIWNSLLRYRVQNAAHFQYHWKCKELGILNLCFADDVLLFCKAHTPSIQVLKDTLNEFAALSGLNVNPEKSQIILSRAVQQDRKQIIECLGFQEGFLPVRYLGVPLTSSRLTIADCRPLITKIDARLAGKMRKFLWQGPNRRGNAKVAWDQICKPKEEGGLGIRSMTVSNRALMLKQLWRILQNDGTSIWVEWIQLHRLQNSTLWTFNGATGSWGWKKMLKLRPILQQGVLYKIGNGSTFKLWQDIWHERGPLCQLYPLGPAVLDLPLNNPLSCVIQQHQWCWPATTDAVIADITSHLPAIYPAETDSICWRNPSGRFTLESAIMLIHPATPRVQWHGLLQDLKERWDQKLQSLEAKSTPNQPIKLKPVAVHNSLPSSSIDVVNGKDCPAENRPVGILNRSLQEQPIFIGNVKLQTNSTDSIADAFLQSSRKTLHFVPPTKQNGRKPYFPQLESFARSNWSDLHQVSATSSGFYFFQFKTRDAMEELKHLPMEYWTEEGLSTVASGVGTPLYADKITRQCLRLDFARMCVMLDYNSTLPKHLVVISPHLIDGKEIPIRVDVEYEWLPQRFRIFVKKQQVNHDKAELVADKEAEMEGSKSTGTVQKLHRPSQTPQYSSTDQLDRNNPPNLNTKGKDIVLYNPFDALDAEIANPGVSTEATANFTGPNICSPGLGDP